MREALAIEIDTSLPAQRVVRVLQQLEAWRGLPKAIRLDNGPELTSQYLGRLVQRQGYRTAFYPARQAESKCFHRALKDKVPYDASDFLAAYKYEAREAPVIFLHHADI